MRKSRKPRSNNDKETVYNFSIIRLKSSGYISLDKLGTIDKILMTLKYYLDKNYRDEARMLKKIKDEQKRNERIFFLRKYLLDILRSTPTEAHDIKIQIDNSYLDILDDTISTGFKDYVIDVVKMNRNYFKFIKTPHPILKFNFKDNVFKDLVIGGEDE